MFSNPAWFENDENALLLADFATRQPNLIELRLFDNGFSKQERSELKAEMNQMFDQMPNRAKVNIDMAY